MFLKLYIFPIEKLLGWNLSNDTLYFNVPQFVTIGVMLDSAPYPKNRGWK